MTTRKDILFPVGRLVSGSLQKPQVKKDDNGKPILNDKPGPDFGKPVTSFYFAIAIPKQPGHTHWSQTEWGAIIWAVGHADHPGVASNPAFSWKIDDGDSTVPNRRGKKPCDQEGAGPGFWVLKLSSQIAPTVYTGDGKHQIDPAVVKRGFYVQVYGSVAGNTGKTPGVYLNHSKVAFAAEGVEISAGLDASEVGFGQNVVLPAGATPVQATAGFAPINVAALPPPPSAGLYAAAAAAGVMPPPPVVAPVVAAPPVAVVPNPAILMPPPPVVPVVPAAPVGPVMTAKAAGLTYQQLQAGGWTHEAMVQHGYVAA